MTEKVFVSMGSNLGKREENFDKALRLIRGLRETDVVALSPVYESEPWGIANQPRFFNRVVELATKLDPRALLNELKGIEAEIGRPPKDPVRWGPRLIDLDIVFFGSMIVREPGLTIPHQHAHEREFILRPLSDIAPAFVHPLLGEPVSKLLRELGTHVNSRRVAI